MNSNSILSGDFSEQQWVDRISEKFDDEGGDNISDIPVCVFNVPKATSRFKPEAYVPLAVALGPYHHFETHLYQMERFKVAAVKAILSSDQVLSFESLVINRLIEKESVIRACYHKYINLYDDTLAWIFAIDGLFLIGLFTHYADISNLMPKKLINNGVLYRDVMVLENQIPLYLLKEIWKALSLSTYFQDQNGDRELISMMRKFCEVHSPLKLAKDFNYDVKAGCLHLLDLMYHSIVDNQDIPQAPRVEILRKDNDYDVEKIAKEDNLTENLEEIMEMGLRLGMREKADLPIKVIKNIPWEKVSNLLGLKLRKQDKEEDDDLAVVTEFEIPSVSSLIKYAQINFSYTNGGVRDIKFDENKATLYLPIITLGDYSEVMLRNLLAYEVATSSSTAELAQYVYLMSGIVDTEADVKLLRDKGVIKGNMNDKDIANLFHGMNKSNLNMSSNKTIDHLNEYYNNRPMIKTWRFVKKDLLCSKKVATVVLAIFASLLMILYSFCEVYGCSRLFGRQ
ncbi:hypothetical protein HanRHA438_Chr10g0474181 [Helianthus annuus]|uniref:Uncharacterized protein n=1 Tax=Helianthus annuus TaxID=4232 RepID=A0A251TP85_HELAN|nr:putative UPF0481 protein At3g02645 [Helianthus annuus]KAF5788235.1 hypothetical protein HanXRQr2_Chr10g0461761 [Helianthus annuus]KAJ0515305.1 hypothetical protein HanHA300_Chr10g0379171 [Helianthus annuus]KAJ0531500.1 hypothetical protein HanHA89_Chr10g0401751 [Helianthus annuus]KAJ0698341.1 hypothetical protein HanLR1_Chr10g0378971 [Helianthus annuus]KAJ0881426.1 hypothetical protein HanRHA438_Chr10g0474181 [Helianthus annuus]